MKKLIAFALAAGITLSVGSTADARQGCGRGFHRGYHGRCVPNDRAWARHHRVLVVDRYYPGRGYWDGRRYWQHRTRWHGHWRYR